MTAFLLALSLLHAPIIYVCESDCEVVAPADVSADRRHITERFPDGRVTYCGYVHRFYRRPVCM